MTDRRAYVRFRPSLYRVALRRLRDVGVIGFPPGVTKADEEALVRYGFVDKRTRRVGDAWWACYSLNPRGAQLANQLAAK